MTKPCSLGWMGTGKPQGASETVPRVQRISKDAIAIASAHVGVAVANDHGRNGHGGTMGPNLQAPMRGKVAGEELGEDAYCVV